MSNGFFWPSIITVIVALIAVAVAGQSAAAKRVKVCADVKLPAAGKCSYLTVRGYKVRVCA